MTIGSDIKEVLQDVGVAITILRDSGNVTGEFAFTKSNAQVTKPFIREFFLEGQVAYDTQLVVGDIIQMNTSGKVFMVMNLTPDLLENTIFRHQVVFYMCNLLVDVLRPSDDDFDQRYRSARSWSFIARQKYCLITTPLYGHELSSDDEIGKLGIEVHEMYVPSSLGIKALDRIQISSLQYYKVEAVKPRRFEAVDVLELREDNRGSYTTTTTTTTTTA